MNRRLRSEDVASRLGHRVNARAYSFALPERGLFEPVHGTAPDIAGEGVANPVGMVLSAGMLLKDVGEAAAAAALRDAVAGLLADADAPRTPDLGGTAGTEEVIEDLSARL